MVSERRGEAVRKARAHGNAPRRFRKREAVLAVRGYYLLDDSPK